MKPKRPRGTGSIFQFRGAGPWWIAYYRNGVAVRESSHTDKQKEAEKLLQRRLAEVSQGTFIEPRDRKITVDELYSAVLDDYRTTRAHHSRGHQIGGLAGCRSTLVDSAPWR